MTIRKPITSLPDWAFKALGNTAIDVLIDRTEHEVIVMTRRGVPELVLMNHADWDALVEASAKRQAPHEPTMAAEGQA
jgi:PHD/YefM family antitoxin component YafN of YafNO toxin-antitoxin module